MLDLDDRSAWERLKHAYGSASDIPVLLRAVEPLPPYVGGMGDPYSDLWSALCHQGDIYSASYAAVPHLVRIAAGGSRNHEALVLAHLAAYVELERDGIVDPEVPPDVAHAYHAALALLPHVALTLLQRSESNEDARMGLFILAVCAGHRDEGLAIEELSDDIVDALLDGSVEEFVYARKHGEVPGAATSLTLLEENWMRMVSRKPDGSRLVEYFRAQRRHK
jgi:hypothetical protein